MSKTKKISVVVLIVLVILACIFIACKSKNKSIDSESLTMYIGLGNTNSEYYSKLHDLIEEDLGIDIQYVYNNTMNTTGLIDNMVSNYDVPADIMVTSKSLSKESQAANFLDLSSYTNLPDYFTISKLQNAAIDGAVYQMPFTTRLIGIEYNKTLFDEMGWEVPHTYKEMLDLKKKADKEGYNFAIACTAATGHGFNYLFHVMGTQYLSTPDGAEWFDEFLNGDATIDDFASQGTYFAKYVEAGLFGTAYDVDWNGDTKFAKTRSLFYYSILNDINSYDGPRYNMDGTLYGATYDEEGKVVAKESAAGDFVIINGEYVPYDSQNPDHKVSPRYDIPGTEMLHDKFGSIPWISESGSSNCYTAYDCMFVSLRKELAETGQEKKLDDAVKVLEYMAGEKAIQLFAGMFGDGYVSVKDFSTDKERLYESSIDSVEKGFLMPWYYNYFNDEIIVTVGEKVNQYISGEGISLGEIMNELSFRVSQLVMGNSFPDSAVSDTFTYEETANLLASVSGMSLQKVIDESLENDSSLEYLEATVNKGSNVGISQKEALEVKVALLPYTESVEYLPAGKSVGVVQSRFYKGDIITDNLNLYITSGFNQIQAAEMTGKEIMDLVNGGYNLMEDYEIDKNFKYTLSVKKGESLIDDETYIVALPTGSIEKSKLEGIKLLDYKTTAFNAINEYFSSYKVITPGSLVWTR